jgi:hypothetical protein
MAEKPRRDPDDQPPVAPDKKLSLWPLSVEEAVGAILQVPPMPKDKEKAPRKGRRKDEQGQATAPQSGAADS